jgi:hypothetical protein
MFHGEIVAERANDETVTKEHLGLLMAGGGRDAVAAEQQPAVA